MSPSKKSKSSSASKKPKATKLSKATLALRALYRRVMGPPDMDWDRGLYTVRVWDGMDGCWCDCSEATSVTGDVALQKWSKETKGGTEKVNFSQIDYYRIFPADTKMAWDGREGREMFR